MSSLVATCPPDSSSARRSRFSRFIAAFSAFFASRWRLSTAVLLFRAMGHHPSVCESGLSVSGGEPAKRRRRESTRRWRHWHGGRFQPPRGTEPFSGSGCPKSESPSDQSVVRAGLSGPSSWDGGFAPRAPRLCKAAVPFFWGIAVSASGGARGAGRAQRARQPGDGPVPAVGGGKDREPP